MLKIMKRFKADSSTELNSDDNIFGDEIEFNETPIDLGTPIKTFSFGNVDTNKENNNNLQDNKQSNTKDTINKENNTLKVDSPNLNKETNIEKIRGLTTPINGEMFNIKRSYQFRESTLRKLTELKLIDSDINIYLNQIIDKAICFYYDHVINENFKK